MGAKMLSAAGLKNIRAVKVLGIKEVIREQLLVQILLAQLMVLMWYLKEQT
jgi:hypothetical protein